MCLTSLTFPDQSSKVGCNGMGIACSHNCIRFTLGLLHRVGTPPLVSAISNAGGLGEFVELSAILHG